MHKTLSLRVVSIHTQYTTGRIVWAKCTSHCRVIITRTVQPAYTDDGGYLLYFFTCIAFRERVCSCDMRVSGYGCVYNIFMYIYTVFVFLSRYLCLSLAHSCIYIYTYINTYKHTNIQTYIHTYMYRVCGVIGCT